VTEPLTEKFVTPCPLPTPYERELLTILIEEASEIQQRATKALRFGLDEVQPGQSLNNAQRLDYEIGDFLAVLRRLQAIDISNTFAIEEAAKAKELKLKKYMQTELGEEK
jgi:NTP pyrophosphatase (non-canonical NTP hydrolase)